MSDFHLIDGNSSITVELANAYLCAGILKLDQQNAKYRNVIGSNNTGKMCDYGILTRNRHGNYVAAVELKSNYFSDRMFDQLQMGLDLLFHRFANLSSTSTARAVLVSKRPLAQAKRLIQNKPGLLRKSRSLNYGGTKVSLDLAECQQKWIL